MRRTLFRIAAILLGLMPVLTAELALRWFDWPPPPAVDPYVDLHKLRPLFEPVPGDPDRLHIGQQRLHLFRPASFSRQKPPGTFRIFALGGSTTQGEPYSTETAFPRWAGEALQLADPGRHYEVINCGGLSYASYRVFAILREVLQYDPDLIMLYTGHNEFLEKRTYEESASGGWRRCVSSTFEELRIVRLARTWMHRAEDHGDRPEKSRTVLQAEVDALLDYQGGLEQYHRGDRWRDGVVEHFEWNLQQMVRACRNADVPLVLIKPVSNLADCPPMKIEIDPSLPSAQRRRFEDLWETARTATSPSVAQRAAAAALEIDPQHAGAHFLLGRLAYEAGQADPALVHLTMARDYDVCPLRAPTPILQATQRVAAASHCSWVDAEQLFASRSDLEIVGNRWLVDHIHPKIEGHQLLGREIAAACIRDGIVIATQADWMERVEPAFQQVLAALDESYFQRAQQRLEGLLLWTQGRAKKIRGATASPSTP
ncbi:MAG: SGNH/GDSL hydrolase family protein [Planctomycetota bacterium]|nr:MAG: SGNH/GDSL hydrolase family protein [Planctomycetota bacterium]